MSSACADGSQMMVAVLPVCGILPARLLLYWKKLKNITQEPEAVAPMVPEHERHIKWIRFGKGEL
ncbi:hypothetical protein ACO9S2_03880 [Nitrospira sp. NS4]|uniref:hypothetical protein n=1 Tax=Nitrospira sp. NS4 TaxID=3414498 RepID=UPI003C2E0B4C